MDKKQAFGKNNSRSSYFVILGIMCFAILVVITAAFKNDILRDIYAFSNTIIDIIGLVFLVLLFGFSFSRAGDTKRPAQAFKLLLTLVFATVKNDTACHGRTGGRNDDIYSICDHKSFCTCYFCDHGTGSMGLQRC